MRPEEASTESASFNAQRGCRSDLDVRNWYQIAGRKPQICIKSVLVDLATVGAALNDCGEYERGKILLEAIRRRAETIKDYRAQFVAIEGLALSAFYLGNRQLSRGYLDKGLALAMQLNKQRQVDRFKNLGENHVEGMTTVPADHTCARQSSWSPAQETTTFFHWTEKRILKSDFEDSPTA